MDNKTFLELVETEMQRLAVEYKKHADMHRKNARFWLFAMLLATIYIIICIFLPF